MNPICLFIGHKWLPRKDDPPISDCIRCGQVEWFVNKELREDRILKMEIKMNKWEEVHSDGSYCFRLKVPGGWLVRIYDQGGAGITFYPDFEHKWQV